MIRVFLAGISKSVIASKNVAKFQGWLEAAKGLAAAKLQVQVTVIVSLAVFGLQAVHTILLARLLGPLGRGEYGTIVFYSQSLLYMGLIGTHYSIARAATHQSNAGPELQRAAFRVGLITGTASALIALAAVWIGFPASKAYLIPTACICCMLLPFEHVRLTAQAVDHGRGDFSRYNISRFFAACLFPIVVVGLFFAVEVRLEVIAWLTVLVAAIGTLFYWLISENKQWLKGRVAPSATSLLKSGLPDGLLVFANDSYDRLAILLVIWFASLTDQGFFLTAFPLAYLLLVAPNAIELFAFRAASDPESEFARGPLIRSALGIVCFQIIVLVALQIMLGPIVHLLLSEKFASAIPIARILIVAMALSGLTIVSEGFLRGRQKTRHAIGLRLLAGCVMLASFFLLPIPSTIERVAWSMTLGHAINAGLAFCLVMLSLRPDISSLSSISAELNQ